PVRQRQRLAALEDPAFATGRNAERVGRLDVEAARAVVLDERVAERRDAVVERERVDAVLAALELLAHVELDEGEPVRQPAEERAQPREQLLEAARAVDRERDVVAAAKRERLQHPGQAEEVIGVVVREEDLLEVGQADRGALQLALRALGAVEEQALAPAADEQR